MPAYQGSTNQGCEVTLYRQQGEAGNVTLMSGKNADSKEPALISCHVVNAIGGGGSFGFVCKPERGDTFFDSVVDDDWVDIVFTKNGKKWHVLRGLVDEVRCTRQAGGSGATSVTYTVTGRTWQKILTDTSVYLNIGQREDALGTLARTVADSVYGGLAKVQSAILLNVLKFLAQAGRGAWAMPLGMYNSQGQFYNTVQVNTDGVSKALPRTIPIQPFTIDNGTVWSLAQQYSDPIYTEMFCEQANFSVPPAQRFDLTGKQGLGIADTAMTVVIRDRPYIAVDPRCGAAIGMNSPWFALPKLQVDAQSIVAEDLGRSGQDRFNSFNAFEGFGQVLMKRSPNAGFSPIWSPEEMYTHGLRRFDATSPYSYDAVAGAAAGVSEYAFTQRRKVLVKDWYALNSRYLNGSIQLGTGAPHLHIGCRVFVPGYVEAENLTAYIETVTHTWQLNTGTRTSLGVTRGYRGSDQAHLAALQTAAGGDKYEGARFGF